MAELKACSPMLECSGSTDLIDLKSRRNLQDCVWYCMAFVTVHPAWKSHLELDKGTSKDSLDNSLDVEFKQDTYSVLFRPYDTPFHGVGLQEFWLNSTGTSLYTHTNDCTSVRTQS